MASNGQTMDPLPPMTGLDSLADLQKKVNMDSRRAIASIGLNRSMQTWIARKSPYHGQDGNEFDSCSPKGSKSMTVMAARESSIRTARSSTHNECILSLEQAFYAHAAAFDTDVDCMICVEELIIIFERCYLFDEFVTPNKVRNYFNTWVDGCNHVNGTSALPDSGIGYEEFKDVLQWAADMKSQTIAECAQKVVRLSRKLCDKSASVQRRLEVVFDAFCKKDPQYMSAFEFGNLCQKIGVYEQDKFTMGDVYCLFFQINGVVHGTGVSFDGFISVLAEVGKRLEIGEEVYSVFARAVEVLDTDEETIGRVKMRLRQAASIVGGHDWRQFFHDFDADGSGSIDWDEFLALCREKLHLADRDNHLRILFDRLDEEGSGELNISILTSFIAET